MKRLVVGLAAVVVAGMLLGSLALWLLLARWVPVEGKARVIQELERRWPVTVTIGQMRYSFLRGLMVDDVRIAGRATQEAWAVLPAMRVHIARLPLLNRRVVFRGRVSLQHPCPADVALAGAYSFRDRSLTLAVQTTDIPLRDVTEPLTSRLPRELKDGTVRLELRLAQPASGTPELAGRLTGTGLVWATPQWRASGNLTLNGSASPPPRPGDRWSVQGLARLDRGTLDGVPAVGTISRLEGRARITENRVEVETLTGIALDSAWALEGVLMLSPLTVETLVTARQQLAPLAAAVPAVGPSWQPEGTAALRAVCRGPLAPTVFLDCLARATVEGAVLNGVKLTEPVTDLTGTADYDALTRRLTLSSLSGRIRGKPVTARGDVAFGHPVELALHTSGTIPFKAAAPWLRPGTPVRELDGETEFDLDLTGEPTALFPTGTVKLRGVSAALAAPVLVTERLNASAELTPETIIVRQSAMTLNGRPLSVEGSMTRTATPEIIAVARFPEGELRVKGILRPDAVVIEESLLSLAKSRLRVQGRLSREAKQSSALAVSGTVELSELATLPFLPLPALEPWALRGAAEVQGEFQGRFDQWQTASLRARVRSEHLQARQLPLDQFVCTVEQRDRVLRVQLPSALFSDGKLSGELTVRHEEAAPQTFLLQADLIGIALDRLSQVIPAWRNRSVMGRASAHAALSGTWPARSSWTGEGWFKGEGEHLGDLPLLDKLFRGLFGVLADRLGLEALRRAQITSASGRWQLAQERVRTEDLRLGGTAGEEPVAIYAKGSVGLDRTLDFVIDPELSEGALLEAPAISTLARTVLKAAGRLERLRQLIGRHRLTGTLNEPVYRFEFSTQETFKQLAPTPADLLQNLLDAVR